MPLVEWQDALAHILEEAKPLQPVIGHVHSVPGGAILAEAVHADCDSPPFLKALMDGFALAGDTPVQGTSWPVAGKNLAGNAPVTKLDRGWACRIATGAPLPPGADRVIPKEQTRDLGEQVQIDRVPSIWAFTAEPGSDFRKGDRLLAPGAIFNAGAAAALATCGKTDVRYIPNPTVAVISTGTELVEPGKTPTGSQIRNSNGPMLVAAAQSGGGLAEYLGLVADSEESLKKQFSRGLNHPVMIITGGVSVGEKDLVRPVLESLGVRILVHGVRLKPGKPFLFGVSPQGCLVFGLPGNPTSSLANFDLFVRPAMLKIRGYQKVDPFWIQGKLTKNLTVDNNRPTMRPVRVEPQSDGWKVIDLGAKGSFESGILARAPGWMFLEPGKWDLTPDSEIRVLVPGLTQKWAELTQPLPE